MAVRLYIIFVLVFFINLNKTITQNKGKQTWEGVY